MLSVIMTYIQDGNVKHIAQSLFDAKSHKSDDLNQLDGANTIIHNAIDKFVEASTHRNFDDKEYSQELEDRKTIIRMLIESGFDKEHCNDYGHVPLTLAISHKNADVVKLLLQCGCDPNNTDEHHESPLMYALNQALPQDGLNRHTPFTALSEMAKADLEILDLLISHGASVLKTSIVHPKCSAFHTASRSDCMAMQETAHMLSHVDDTHSADETKRSSAKFYLRVIQHKWEVGRYEPSLYSHNAQHTKSLYANDQHDADTNTRSDKYNQSIREQHCDEQCQSISPDGATFIDTEHRNALLSQWDNVRPERASYYPLHIAVMKNLYEATARLIEAGAKVNCTDNNGDTPLHIAARYADHTVIQLLLDNGAKYNALNSELKTPLACAAESNIQHTCMILQLHAYRKTSKPAPSNVDYNDEEDHSHILVNDYGCSTSIMHETSQISAFLMQGYDINSTKTSSRSKIQTMLGKAVILNNFEVTLFLLKHGANPNLAAHSVHCTTPLHYAAQNSNKDIAELLLNFGAKVDAQDHTKLTPLIYACRFLVEPDTLANAYDEKVTTRKDLLNLLISKGANVNHKDMYGYSAIHHLCANIPQYRAVTYVQLHGSAIDMQSELIRILVNNKADVNAQDKTNVTPLHIALSTGNQHCAVQLIACKAHVNHYSNSGVFTLDCLLDYIAQTLSPNPSNIKLYNPNQCTVHNPISPPPPSATYNQSDSSDADPDSLAQRTHNVQMLQSLRLLLNSMLVNDATSIDAYTEYAVKDLNGNCAKKIEHIQCMLSTALQDAQMYEKAEQAAFNVQQTPNQTALKRVNTPKNNKRASQIKATANIIRRRTFVVRDKPDALLSRFELDFSRMIAKVEQGINKQQDATPGYKIHLVNSIKHLDSRKAIEIHKTANHPDDDATESVQQPSTVDTTSLNNTENTQDTITNQKGPPYGPQSQLQSKLNQTLAQDLATRRARMNDDLDNESTHSYDSSDLNEREYTLDGTLDEQGPAVTNTHLGDVPRMSDIVAIATGHPCEELATEPDLTIDCADSENLNNEELIAIEDDEQRNGASIGTSLSGEEEDNLQASINTTPEGKMQVISRKQMLQKCAVHVANASTTTALELRAKKGAFVTHLSNITSYLENTPIAEGGLHKAYEMVPVRKCNQFDISTEENAIELLAKDEQPDAIKFLRYYNANPNPHSSSAFNPLMYAIEKRNAHLADALVTMLDADVNFADTYGDTPLIKHLAMACTMTADPMDPSQYTLQRTTFNPERQDEEGPILKLLLDNNANVNACNKSGLNPLYYAVIAKRHDHFKQLLDHGANADIKINGSPLICIAARTRSKAIIQLMLSNDVNPNAIDKQGNTALINSLENYSTYGLEVFFMLCAHGADINFPSKKGATRLLNTAVQQDTFTIVQSLLEQGINVQYSDTDRSPLNTALESRNYQTAKLLLEHGIKSSKQYLMEAILSALDSGDTELAHELISLHTMSTLSKEQQYTVISKAVKMDYHHIVSLMINRGINVNISTMVADSLNKPQRKSDPLLLVAIKSLCISSVQILLVCGAKIDHSTLLYVFQDTYIEQSEIKAQNKIFKLLLDYGASCNLCSNGQQYWSPLHKACQGNNPELIGILLTQGADPYQQGGKALLSMLKLIIDKAATHSGTMWDDALKQMLMYTMQPKHVLAPIASSAAVYLLDTFYTENTAYATKHKPMLSALLACGANPGAVDNAGDNLLCKAVKFMRFGDAKLLLMHGNRDDLQSPLAQEETLIKLAQYHQNPLQSLHDHVLEIIDIVKHNMECRTNPKLRNKIHTRVQNLLGQMEMETTYLTSAHIQAPTKAIAESSASKDEFLKMLTMLYDIGYQGPEHLTDYLSEKIFSRNCVTDIINTINKYTPCSTETALHHTLDVKITALADAHLEPALDPKQKQAEVACNQNINEFEVLLAKLGDISYQDPDDGSTYLHTALRLSLTDISAKRTPRTTTTITKLLSYGIDIDKADYFGQYPIKIVSDISDIELEKHDTLFNAFGLMAFEINKKALLKTKTQVKQLRSARVASAFLLSLCTIVLIFTITQFTLDKLQLPADQPNQLIGDRMIIMVALVSATICALGSLIVICTLASLKRNKATTLLDQLITSQKNIDYRGVDAPCVTIDPNRVSRGEYSTEDVLPMEYTVTLGQAAQDTECGQDGLETSYNVQPQLHLTDTMVCNGESIVTHL